MPARRLGEESGACVVIDCLTGDILCMASMPAYDPNSFSDGIGRTEWKMLSEDERKPLLNKALNALYPPGIDDQADGGAGAAQHGVDPDETILLRRRLPARQPLLPLPRPARHGGHAPGDRQELQHLFLRDGPPHRLRQIAPMASAWASARSSTCRWSARAMAPCPTARGSARYEQNKRLVERPDWTASDTLNASIGQGFLIVNPLQLAVMAARIASGRDVQPRLIGVHNNPPPLLGLDPEHLETVRGGMWEVVNGDGTAGASRLPIPGIEMCGKTGTAQVRGSSASAARPERRLEISRPRPVRLLRRRWTSRATPARW